MRRLLVGLDAAAAAFAWGSVFSLTGGLTAGTAPSLIVGAFVVSALTAVTIALIAGQRLYLARVCTVRAVEVGRLARAAVGAALVALVMPRFLPVGISNGAALGGAGASFLLAMTARGLYRSWLTEGRRQGRFVRPIVVVGANDEAFDLYKLLKDHPELGFTVAAVVGPTMDQVRFPTSIPHLQSFDRTLEAIEEYGATGALVAGSALGTRQLNRLTRLLIERGVHVHLSSGLRGIAHRRIRSQPLAHEPIFYVEPLRLAGWQLAAKRAVDLAAATVGFLVVSPILVAAAVAIKAGDNGPILYRQRRVGRWGQEFVVFKLRTMVVDADQHYDELARTMAGREGPLIKLANDPRRTRVGRVLERLSIDELPQLWNVLRGEMSLIGPRPAQAREVAEFDEELLQRHEVLPGITGLWQVEARDNPSFGAYKRFDLFYIENWSVSLDLAILIQTFQRVLFRGIEFVARRDGTELKGAVPHIVGD